MHVATKFVSMDQAAPALQEQLAAEVADAGTHRDLTRSVQPPFGAVWPGATHAIVEPAEPCVTQSAPRSRRGWRVKFAPQDAPFADPLTGWTGGSDPLQQVELRFSSRAAAEEYLARQGLRYCVHEPPPRRWKPAIRPGYRAAITVPPGDPRKRSNRS